MISMSYPCESFAASGLNGHIINAQGRRGAALG